MKKQPFKYFTSLILLCSILLLNACVQDLYPTDATEEITLLKDGTFEVRYEGKFHDIYDFFKFLEREQPSADMPSHEEYQVEMTKQLNNIDGLKVKNLNQGRYDLNYHIKNMGAATFPLFSPNLLNDTKFSIFSFVQLTENGQALEVDTERSGTLFGEKDKFFDELNDNPESSDNLELKTRLQAALKTIKGTLIIKTDGFVATHNAASVSKLAGGITEYRWLMNADLISKVNFTLFMKKDAFDQYQFDAATSDLDCIKLPQKMQKICRLRVAKPGTSCKELIGEDCQCGPFKLSGRNGEIMKHTAYRIDAAQTIKYGCSDEKGNIPAVLTLVTGDCKLRFLGTKATMQEDMRRADFKGDKSPLDCANAP